MALSSESYSSMKFTLNTGAQMPAVGLGTFRIRCSDDIMRTLDFALDAGYRMFDTAAVYGNEGHMRDSFKVLLPKYDLEREDIFITTKLAPSDHGDVNVIEKAYRKSLKNLGLDYVDLYLIHFPGSSGIHATDSRNKKLRELSWSGLEEIYEDGRVKAIGVANYTIRHLQEQITADHSVIPAVNQVEWHPYYHQKDLLRYCKERDIVLQAYCTFGGTSASNYTLLQDPVVANIAKKLNVTSAQVLLVWALQQEVAVIPKSIHKDRIKQNISLNFKISDEDFKALDALGEHNIKYTWDPSVVA